MNSGLYAPLRFETNELPCGKGTFNLSNYFTQSQFKNVPKRIPGCLWMLEAENLLQLAEAATTGTNPRWNQIKHNNSNKSQSCQKCAEVRQLCCDAETPFF